MWVTAGWKWVTVTLLLGAAERKSEECRCQQEVGYLSVGLINDHFVECSCVSLFISCRFITRNTEMTFSSRCFVWCRILSVRIAGSKRPTVTNWSVCLLALDVPLTSLFPNMAPVLFLPFKNKVIL